MKRRRLTIQPKLTLGLVLMAFALTAAITFTISAMYAGNMEQHYASMAFDHASIAAQMIDGDKVAQYYNTRQKDDYYNKISDYLLKVKKEALLKYFYVVVPEDKQMVYIWDSGEPDEHGALDLGDVDYYYGDENKLMHKALSSDEKASILITNSDEYGYLASAYVPIKDSSGNPVALARADMSMDTIHTQVQHFILIAALVAALVMVLAGALYYLFIRRAVILPAMKLQRAASGLAHADISNLDSLTIDVHTGDEFDGLARAFEQMTSDLAANVRSLAGITAEKERISTELSVATHIQSSMLPCIFPPFPDRPEFDIFASMNPAKEVGGDFYDFFMVDDSHIAIVMADVSDKGVPAALFMVIGKTLIKDHTQPGMDLGEVFSQVNSMLCESNSQGMFITAFEGVLDLRTGELRYVNAGHEAPYVSRGGNAYEQHKVRAGFVLAGMEGMRYKSGSMMLEPGDRIFLYTDGVTEAADEHNNMYGSAHLKRALDEGRELEPSMLLSFIKSDIDAFAGNAPQFDDITMLNLVFKQRMAQQ